MEEYDPDQGERIVNPTYITEEMATHFFSMFWGREDVYAKQGKNGGYFPQCNNRWDARLCPKQRGEKGFCDECENTKWTRLDVKKIIAHLLGYKEDKGDIVVTQDYGVAAMALGKGAYAIHQSGKWYTNENIDQMLMERHLNKKARRTSHKNHLKGRTMSGGHRLCADRSGSGDPKKRTEEDDKRFAQSFEKFVLMARTQEGD